MNRKRARRRPCRQETRWSSTPPAADPSIHGVDLSDDDGDSDEHWERKMKRTWSEFERDLDGAGDDDSAFESPFDYDPLTGFDYDTD